MKKVYKATRIGTDRMEIIFKANEIIETYQAQGYELTLRQLYYQFVARDLLPNNDKSYDMLGEVISQARLSGMVDWNAIKDRTRFVRQMSHWDSPAEIITASAEQYRRDLWEDQPVRVEVWVEKDALIDVVEQAAKVLDIPAFSCRGYVSQTAMWEASQRILGREAERTVILHLGDHDPSGIDMTRDIQERLDMFEAGAKVERIALTMEQVEQYDPPPNPAKLSDSRCADYIANYGDSSWELDALEPSVLTELIQDNAMKYCDAILREKAEKRQAKEKKVLQVTAKQLMKKFAKK